MTVPATGVELRMKPSGFVHRVARCYDNGPVYVQFLCGASRFQAALTADFPPAARRCTDCVDKHERIQNTPARVREVDQALAWRSLHEDLGTEPANRTTPR